MATPARRAPTSRTETQAEREKRIRRRLRDDFFYYASKCLTIRPKEGDPQRLTFNRAQRYLHAQAEQQLAETGMVRIVGLKGRQQGFSTYVGARAYHKASHRKGYRVFIQTHEDKATVELFGMAKRYHDDCPALVRPVRGKSNDETLSFSKLDSSYGVGTAGAANTGRGQTVQFLHASEHAFWKNAVEHMRGIFRAVPRVRGSEIWVESTSDGPGNQFHTMCLQAMSGENGYRFVFVPWFWQEEYQEDVPDGFVLTAEERELLDIYGGEQADGGPGMTPRNLVWRRREIADTGISAFQKEYPNTHVEAFNVATEDKLIDPAHIEAAKHRDVSPAFVRPIWGVDCARKGKDDSTLAKRVGNVQPEKVKSWDENDTMVVAGRIVVEYRNTPREDRPSHIVVDSIGIGGPVADRLREVFEDERWDDDTRVVDCNVGETAAANERFDKVRDELWYAAREWFEGKGCKIQPDDVFEQEMAAPEFTYLSSGKIKVEDKDKTKKKIGRSPDRADAHNMTFYVTPVPRGERREGGLMRGGFENGGVSWMGSL